MSIIEKEAAQQSRKSEKRATDIMVRLFFRGAGATKPTAAA
jgi:hypothetical protein